MSLAEIDAAIDYLTAGAQTQRPCLTRLGPVAARHTGDLGLRDLQASSEHALLAVLRQLPRHARIIEPRAVQEDHVMSASAQLPHHRIEIAEEVHVLADHHDFHAIPLS